VVTLPEMYTTKPQLLFFPRMTDPSVYIIGSPGCEFYKTMSFRMDSVSLATQLRHSRLRLMWTFVKFYQSFISINFASCSISCGLHISLIVSSALAIHDFPLLIRLPLNVDSSLGRG
jgi:hypothetical protein